MAEPTLTRADLGAAVAAGQISEAQAAGLTALAEARAGRRAAMAPDDEPFELYRGFNDIFVAVGMVILLAGLRLFSPATPGLLASGAGPGTSPAASVGWALFMGALIWGLAEYFTRRRRMVTPSIVLVLHLSYSLGLIPFAFSLPNDTDPVLMLTAGFAVAAAAAAAFHLRFGLPFALLPAGAALLAALISATGRIDQAGLDALKHDGFKVLVDLGGGTAFPLVTLAFGLGAFALAMRYDLADPHRVTRRAACGFWLHLMAAPAIVNTAAFTLYAGGGPLATAALVAFLLALAAVALVVDRRSFLLSGAGYVAALMIAGLGEGSVALVLVFLGALILGLGAGWTGLRARLMRAVPEFPAKHRLPPWAGAEAAP